MEKMIALVLPMALWYLSFVLPHAAASSSVSPSPVVCAGSGAPPVTLGDPLGFCGYSGISCCNVADDAALRAQFEDKNISDAACAAIVKAVLCARCIPFLSAVLFNTADPTKLSVPLLCAAGTPWSSSTAHHPVTASARSTQEPDTMCLERISAGSYLNMAAHPDGSGRVFLSSRDGKIWLASMPKRGSGAALRVHRPFLDLTDRVLELVGVAFHPEFATNGRFFVSYSCDSSASPACGASRCWGAAAENGSKPCRYQFVVAEFSAKGGADYSKATRANPSEASRIFAMGLPQPHTSYSYQNHGGQILFQPKDSDGHLYLITGHGDFSKTRRSIWGKIIRFNVGGVSGESLRSSKMDKPEIFSMGLNNPSGCSFDSERPSHLYCADVDDQQHERVYLISNKAGSQSASSSKAVSFDVISHGRPADGRMPSIVGGLVYRGSADPSLEGRYLYMYASGVWTGQSNSSTQMPRVRCSGSSPTPCRFGIVLSLGEDNSKDAFVLATGGVYRVVPPRLCGVPPQPPQWPPATGWVLSLAFAFYLIYSSVCSAAGGGTIQKANIGCCFITCNKNVTNNYHKD
ncbi:HIPL1 protein-like [Phragmites australis]|uniref:HIPL1 protein-like n=1 Tax=Phragmites australis TaxID=29695 RepID=UPI002D7A3EF1|nr:HIPL1 protein-like [Phragmites australis]